MGHKGKIVSRSMKKGKSTQKQFSRKDCQNLEHTINILKEEKEAFIDSCATVDPRSKCRYIANMTYNEKIEETKKQLTNCPK